MRQKRNRLKEYRHKTALLKKDTEGGTYIEYGTQSSFKAEMWTGGGRLQQETYGIRLPNIRNLRIKGSYKEFTEGSRTYYEFEDGMRITVNDGICIYTEEPDYKVIAIYPYRFLTLEVERI